MTPSDDGCKGNNYNDDDGGDGDDVIGSYESKIRIKCYKISIVIYRWRHSRPRGELYKYEERKKHEHII